MQTLTYTDSSDGTFSVTLGRRGVLRETGDVALAATHDHLPVRMVCLVRADGRVDEWLAEYAADWSRSDTSSYSRQWDIASPHAPTHAPTLAQIDLLEALQAGTIKPFGARFCVGPRVLEWMTTHPDTQGLTVVSHEIGIQSIRDEGGRTELATHTVTVSGGGGGTFIFTDRNIFDVGRVVASSLGRCERKGGRLVWSSPDGGSRPMSGAEWLALQAVWSAGPHQGGGIRMDIDEWTSTRPLAAIEAGPELAAETGMPGAMPADL